MPEPLLLKTKQQIVVATDLARLLKLQELLKQGYQTVIWCDADFLIFNPLNFQVPVTSYALGRGVWVQKDNKNQLRVYIKVHNAFLMFRQGNTFLDFYSETAGKLLTRVKGPTPPQFIGPKLLTALHNIALCPVLENAGMLSPLLIKNVLNGSGNALDLFNKKSPAPISAANLCYSSLQKRQLTHQHMQQAITRLLNDGAGLFT